MAAHKNITTSVPAGITIPSGTELEDMAFTSSVPISELVAGSGSNKGEVVKVGAGNHKTTELTITGEGPIAWTQVAAADVATPSDYKASSLELSDAPNQRVRFSLRAQSEASFTDPAASPDAAGDEPTVTDLEIVSVEYAIVESVRRTKSATDSTLVGTDGAPAARRIEGVTIAAEIAGRGDAPAGFGLGTGGVAFSGSDTGVTMCSRFMTGERRREWNRYSGSAVNYPAAA